MLPLAAGGVSGSVLLTPASATATIALTLSATAPNGAPSLQSDRRVTRAIGGVATSLAYLTAQSSADVTFSSTIGANISVPGPVTGTEYLVLYDPANSAAGWTVVSGAGTAGAGIAPGRGNITMSFTKGATYFFALISTQATLTLQSPSPTPSPSPTATPAPAPLPSPSASPTPTPTASPNPTPSPTPSPTSSPTPTPTPAPTATPAPAPVFVNGPALQFAATGPAYAKTIAVVQANYNGQFALSGTSCNGIAVADTTTSLQNFTVTPLAAGTCSYTVTGGGGSQTTVPVAVTTTTATIRIP